MKKLLTVLFLVTALLVPVIASAEEAPADAKKGPALENRKEVTADQMIERIEGRKAKILEKIKERFDKLNEKLAGFEGRINKISARQEKRARKGEEGKIAGDGAEKPDGSYLRSRGRPGGGSLHQAQRDRRHGGAEQRGYGAGRHHQPHPRG